MPELDPQTNDTQPSPIPEGGLLKPQAVFEVAEATRRRAERFQKMIDAFEDGLRAKAEEVRRGLRSNNVGEEALRPALANSVKKARVDLIRSSEDTRWAELRAFDEAARSLRVTEELFATPAAVLAREGLGTPERTAYQMQASLVGPAGLRNLATLARGTLNKPLAAALCDVVDKMQRRERPFSAQELAAALVGEEQRAVLSAILMVRTEQQRALNLNREFERGGRNPLGRTKVALREREARAIALGEAQRGIDADQDRSTNSTQLPVGLARPGLPDALPKGTKKADARDPTGFHAAPETATTGRDLKLKA